MIGADAFGECAMPIQDIVPSPGCHDAIQALDATPPPSVFIPSTDMMNSKSPSVRVALGSMHFDAHVHAVAVDGDWRDDDYHFVVVQTRGGEGWLATRTSEWFEFVLCPERELRSFCVSIMPPDSDPHPTPADVLAVYQDYRPMIPTNVDATIIRNVPAWFAGSRHKRRRKKGPQRCADAPKGPARAASVSSEGRPDDSLVHENRILTRRVENAERRLHEAECRVSALVATLQTILSATERKA